VNTRLTNKRMVLMIILGLIRVPLMKIMGRFSKLRKLSLTDSLGEIHNYNPRGIKEVISGMYIRGWAVIE
jgi:hypothetical protein